jgi:hypothetical protein
MILVLKKPILILSAAFGALLLTSALAFAEEPAPTPAPPHAANNRSDESIWMFGDREKSCFEWTDGCRGCRRYGQDDVSCSNIGTACQPKEIRCTVPADAPSK